MRVIVSIVEAVVSYAYTGHVDISMNNALPLFLLATTLGCSPITSWCVDFLKPRITMDNVKLVWSVANAAMNDDLMGICIPVIAANLDKFTINSGLYDATEPDYMRAVLNYRRPQIVNEEPKLRAISNWLDAAATEEERAERIDRFEHLVSAVQLQRISPEYFVDFCFSKCILNLPKKCKDYLASAWKVARNAQDSQGGLPSPVVAITAPPREPPDEHIFAYARGNSPNELAFAAILPKLLPGGISEIKISHRRDSEVAVCNGCVYLIGGIRVSGKETKKVDVINPFNGCMSSAPPMTLPRKWLSAAATDHQLFVFGGFGCSRYLSSCEMFDLNTNKQVLLHYISIFWHLAGVD
uniref:BACK domain-containing protein n=1 Tax=Mesocestoides corti TaxID=53468 RepID=A0A5K3FZX5_MESCO